MQINHTHIKALVDRIEDNLAEDVNVIGLSDAFGMSPWHFQRTFKSLVGDTLGGYIRGRRLTRAAEFLLNSDLSIIEIAFSVGFNSHEALTRSFKSYFQCSPKEFRKRRPSIVLEEKPVLTHELYEHLANGMEQEPVIECRAPQHVMGMGASIPSPFVSNEDYCELLYTPWTTLLAREPELSSLKPGTYYGLTISESGSFTEDELTYIAGVPVEAGQGLAEGMTSLVIPEQQVALFEVFAGTENTVSKTVDYIYGYWLPNSPYTRGTGYDYELFEDVTSFEDPDLRSKYVIPIVEKNKT